VAVRLSANFYRQIITMFEELAGRVLASLPLHQTVEVDARVGFRARLQRFSVADECTDVDVDSPSPAYAFDRASSIADSAAGRLLFAEPPGSCAGPSRRGGGRVPMATVKRVGDAERASPCRRWTIVSGMAAKASGAA